MRRRPHNAAFTLVELLVAMAVLAVIIMMMARIFSESTRAFDLGSKIADQNLKGRMVLDFMAREISQAVADEVMGFRLDSKDIELYADSARPEDGDALYFVTLSENALIDEDSDVHRNAREVVYYVTNMVDSSSGISKPLEGRYRLMRAMRGKQDSIACYQTNAWWIANGKSGASVLAENVAGFQVWCYTEPGAPAISDYDSTGSKPEQINQLPMWIEISLMIFDEKDAEHMANLDAFNAPDIPEEAIKRARRYVTRINFVNRNGYASDK
ncbi:MAG TPA: prepilin-type N-terminal cleavage/methylation domain-containing protein [Kiritimatiellia bacterium]|nr:prepilin-type N-terminal cleavage/methylation domain-containing protein [Kiritimatiellia bacterium]